MVVLVCCTSSTSSRVIRCTRSCREGSAAEERSRSSHLAGMFTPDHPSADQDGPAPADRQGSFGFCRGAPGWGACGQQSGRVTPLYRCPDGSPRIPGTALVHFFAWLHNPAAGRFTEASGRRSFRKPSNTIRGPVSSRVAGPGVSISTWKRASGTAAAFSFSGPALPVIL